MSFESGLTFFITIFVFAITPGPGVFALTARALVSGSGSCFSMALGMSIGDVVYLVLACFGLAAIAEHYSGLFMVIRFAGAAYLLYLGWKMWVAEVEVGVEQQHRKHHGVFAGFLQGFLISASNPKVILFYIAFLPTFMDLAVLSGEDIIVAVALTIIGLMMGLMLVSFSAATAKHLFRSGRAMKRLNRTAGGIMAGAGAYLAING